MHPPAHVMFKIKSQESYVSFLASKSNGAGSTVNVGGDGGECSRAIKDSKPLLEEEAHRDIRSNHQLRPRPRDALDDLIETLFDQEAGSPIDSAIHSVEPEARRHRTEPQPLEAEHVTRGTELPHVSARFEYATPNPPVRTSRLRKYASKLGNLIHIGDSSMEASPSPVAT